MRVANSIRQVNVGSSGCCLTIGNFDGVHLGHQTIIKKLLEYSKQLHCSAAVMTFDPHPIKALFPSRGLKNLFSQDDKIYQLDKLGVDTLVIEPFSRELSEKSPESFFDEIVMNAFKAKAVIVGHDFSFGKNRAGTLEVLESLCEKNKVQFEVIPAYKLDDRIISSSLIRESVVEGNVSFAARALGRAFYLNGVVEKGMGRGKKIGFPTANLFSASELFPKNGVYITHFLLRGKFYKSVTNVGVNPTFEEKKKHPVLVESHIFDFDQDIYGENVQVVFFDRLRDEMKFSGIDTLVSQIKEDCNLARKFNWPK